MGGTKSAPTSIGGGDSALPGAFPTGSSSSFSNPLPSSSGGFAGFGGDSDFPSGGGLLDGLSSGGLELSNPVGPGAINAPDDVFKVESTLKGANLLDRAPGRTFQSDTAAGIRNAQTKLNADARLSPDRLPLKIDGLVNPGGPTEQTTRGLAGEVIKSNPVTRTPQVPKPPKPLQTQRTSPVPQPPRPGPVTLKKPAPAPKPALPAAPAFKPGQEAGLRRLAGGLRKTAAPGPVAKDIADAFRANPKGVTAEIKVVKDELKRLGGTPDQLKALDDGIRAELEPEDRQSFDELIGPGGQSFDQPSAAGTDRGESIAPPKDSRQSTPQDDGQNSTFNKFRERLKPREGGFSNNPEDKGGPTQKGMSQRLLNTLNKQHPEWGLPKDSKDLKEAQIRGLYRSEFFDRPKIQKVQDIPEIEKQAPQLPEQLFDAGVLHGPKRAGQWLQQSLDERLGTDLRVPDKNGNLVYDGNVGPKTRAAIGQAIKAGEILTVNDAMVDRRAEFMRKQPNFKDNPGWLARANSFRIGK